MSRWTSLASSVAALCVVGTASWSLTAEQAWETWQNATNESGATITATGQSKSGGVLTVTGVSYAMSIEEVAISSTLGDITFTENTDGSVTIGAPGAYKINVDVAPEYGEKVEVVLGVNQDGMQMTASDAGGTKSYTYSVPTMTMAVESFVVDGEPMAFVGQLSMAQVNGSYATGPTTPPQVTSTYNIQKIDMDIQVQEPDGDGRFNMTASMAGLTGNTSGTGRYPYTDMEALPQMLKDGLSIQGNTLVGSTVFDVSFVDGGENFAMKGVLGGANGGVALSKDQVNYRVSYDGLELTGSGSEIPLPEVSMSLGQLAFNLLMPLAQTNDQQPFVLSTNITNLAIADAMWNMFDPAAVLPRVPASLNIDLAGQMNWLVDVFDPMAFIDTDMPAQVHALSISDLLLSVAGAELTGNGGFTFDNDNLQRFGGMPAPTGTLSLQLVGGNGLLDNLVKMGLIPEQEANTAKLMSGAIARPGDGPDTLVSEFQVTPEGQVLANGIPLPF